MKEQLQARKRELEEQLKPYEKLKEELEEVNTLLATYGSRGRNNPGRGGWEKEGHENGCRCHECDPSR